MLEIKKKIYEAITEAGLPCYDYLPQVDEYPYAMLTTSNSNDTRYKGAKQNILYFTIDIFSNYKGEKQIYEYVYDIDNNIENLFSLGQVMAINREQFVILNDTNPILKHGVLIYKITTMEV